MFEKAVIYRPDSSRFKVEKIEELKEMLKQIGVNRIFVEDDVARINSSMAGKNGVIFFLPCGCCEFLGRAVLGRLIKYGAPIVIGMPSNAQYPIRLSGVILNPTPQELINKALKLHYTT